MKTRINKDAVEAYAATFDEETAQQIVKDRIEILAEAIADDLKKVAASERKKLASSSKIENAEDAEIREAHRNSYEANMILLNNLTEDESEAKKIARERLD